MRARKGDDSGVLSISLESLLSLKSKTENPGQGFRINFPNSLSSLQELEGLETYQLLFPFS